ncbi:MAG: DUF58 domain-containing protein, partial [Lachnospiraceae bacterium]|nr:DUF58 domain-containing protein [Lachnospiraceae bacterium]
MLQVIGIAILAFVLYRAQRWFYQRYWAIGLSVNPRFARSNVMEGEQGELLLMIENRKWMPLPMLSVKFNTDRNLVFSGEKTKSGFTDRYYRNDVFQISGREKITRTLSFQAKKRGYYRIREIDLLAQDLFLSTEMIGNLTCETFLYVYPKPFQQHDFQNSLQRLMGEALTKRHLIEDPFEFRMVREYQPYDDLRHVNWKATARTQELMVNVRNYTSVKTIRIFLNLDDKGILKKEDEIEAAIQVAVTVAQNFLRLGMRVSCYTNGADLLDKRAVVVELGAGVGQMERIFRALARLDLVTPTYDFTNSYRNMILKEAEGAFTFLIAPNVYTEFVTLMSEYMLTDED